MAKQKTYSEKLKDPRWQRVRLEAMELAEWECQKCGASENTLHVHHKQYMKDRDPWDYELNQLAVLCESCHERLHETPDRLIDVISRLPIDGMKWIDRDKAACLLAGAMTLDWFEPQSEEEWDWFRVGLHIQRSVDAQQSARAARMCEGAD